MLRYILISLLSLALMACSSGGSCSGCNSSVVVESPALAFVNISGLVYQDNTLLPGNYPGIGSIDAAYGTGGGAVG
jgi:hypothetical protein